MRTAIPQPTLYDVLNGAKAGQFYKTVFKPSFTYALRLNPLYVAYVEIWNKTIEAEKTAKEDAMRELIAEHMAAGKIK